MEYAAPPERKEPLTDLPHPPPEIVSTCTRDWPLKFCWRNLQVRYAWERQFIGCQSVSGGFPRQRNSATH